MQALREDPVSYTHLDVYKRQAEQCEGCTWVTTQVAELSYLHSRDITFAVFCKGPYGESIRYHDFMDWKMPWYSAEGSREALLEGRDVGMMYIACYVRMADRVFETYWTTIRGVEAMDYSYALMDLTVYGRQETWEAVSYTHLDVYKRQHQR